jgi:hypothetical protein
VENSVGSLGKEAGYEAQAVYTVIRLSEFVMGHCTGTVYTNDTAITSSRKCSNVKPSQQVHLS